MSFTINSTAFRLPNEIGGNEEEYTSSFRGLDGTLNVQTISFAAGKLIGRSFEFDSLTDSEYNFLRDLNNNIVTIYCDDVNPDMDGLYLLSFDSHAESYDDRKNGIEISLTPITPS